MFHRFLVLEIGVDIDSYIYMLIFLTYIRRP